MISVVLQVEIGQVLRVMNVKFWQWTHDLLMRDELGRSCDSIQVPGKLFRSHSSDLELYNVVNHRKEETKNPTL